MMADVRLMSKIKAMKRAMMVTPASTSCIEICRGPRLTSAGASAACGPINICSTARNKMKGSGASNPRRA